MTHEFALAVLFWLAAYASAATAWPAQNMSRRVRSCLLLPLGLVTFALPPFQSCAPLWLRALVTLACPLFGLKLLDLHRDPGHWHARRLSEWLAWLPNPFALVHRLHVLEKPRPMGASARLAMRGAVQVAAGAIVLRWVFAAHLGVTSFWLDHVLKIAGLYLCVFDGGFVLANGLLRLVGSNVMDFSRHPILAVTPADFWRRYNRDAGRFLHEDVYLPAGGLRHPVRGILATFLFNGVLHEYLAWVLCGRIMGYQLLFFMIQGLAVAATFRLRLRTTAAIVGWVATVAFITISSVLFFSSANQIVAWYPDRTLLP